MPYTYQELPESRGASWSYMESCQAIWSAMKLSVVVCSYMEVPGHMQLLGVVWSCMQLYGAIWRFLKLSGVICTYL